MPESPYDGFRGALDDVARRCVSGVFRLTGQSYEVQMLLLTLLQAERLLETSEAEAVVRCADEIERNLSAR
ncbi:hypothetical protein ACIREE_39325 [Streptomyces sp. NPDC102467]|uniref:hypothetical protein n=1 Tax=Streptomyces sp. NPDC102467 TaxID=3366179 RepID=UPI0037F5039A